MAEEILNINDERTEIVIVPEWNNMKILCKNLSGADRAVLSSMLEVDGKTNKVKTKSTTADIVILGAYNPETGDKIFTQAHKSGLLMKNSAPLELLATTIQNLSGLNLDAVADAEKN